MQSGIHPYILIADSHLSDEASTEEFFRMLDCICAFALKKEKSCRPALVFLGDIFDLWIAVPGYERECHRRFLLWCRKYKEEFPIYFIEGNHEFFVAFRHKKDFTFCTANMIREKALVFLHGDMVNLSDWKYRCLRALVRNPGTALLFCLFARYGGTALAEKVRNCLKKTNLEHKKYFPVSFMEKRASQLLKGEKLWLVAGHFHEQHILCEENSGRKICILPAWDKEKGLAGLLSSDGKCTVASWQKLFAGNEKE